MLTVTHWMCPCGLAFRALSELDETQQPPVKAPFTCPGCGRKMELEGELLQVWSERDRGVWEPSSISH